MLKKHQDNTRKMSNKEIIKHEEITLHLLVWKYTKYVYIKNMGGGGGGFMRIRNVMYRIRVIKINNLGEKQNVI